MEHTRSRSSPASSCMRLSLMWLKKLFQTRCRRKTFQVFWIKFSPLSFSSLATVPTHLNSWSTLSSSRLCTSFPTPSNQNLPTFKWSWSTSCSCTTNQKTCGIWPVNASLSSFAGISSSNRRKMETCLFWRYCWATSSLWWAARTPEKALSLFWFSYWKSSNLRRRSWTTICWSWASWSWPSQDTTTRSKVSSSNSLKNTQLGSYNTYPSYWTLTKAASTRRLKTSRNSWTGSTNSDFSPPSDSNGKPPTSSGTKSSKITANNSGSPMSYFWKLEPIDRKSTYSAPQTPSISMRLKKEL